MLSRDPSSQPVCRAFLAFILNSVVFSPLAKLVKVQNWHSGPHGHGLISSCSCCPWRKAPITLWKLCLTADHTQAFLGSVSVIWGHFAVCVSLSWWVVWCAMSQAAKGLSMLPSPGRDKPRMNRAVHWVRTSLRGQNLWLSWVLWCGFLWRQQCPPAGLTCRPSSGDVCMVSGFLYLHLRTSSRKSNHTPTGTMWGGTITAINKDFCWHAIPTGFTVSSPSYLPFVSNCFLGRFFSRPVPAVLCIFYSSWQEEKNSISRGSSNSVPLTSVTGLELQTISAYFFWFWFSVRNCISCLTFLVVGYFFPALPWLLCENHLFHYPSSFLVKVACRFGLAKAHGSWQWKDVRQLSPWMGRWCVPSSL